MCSADKIWLNCTDVIYTCLRSDHRGVRSIRSGLARGRLGGSPGRAHTIKALSWPGGSNPTRGPLLHVIPSLPLPNFPFSLSLYLSNKGIKSPKNNLKKKEKRSGLAKAVYHVCNYTCINVIRYLDTEHMLTPVVNKV